jgi:hypothetical protein
MRGQARDETGSPEPEPVTTDEPAAEAPWWAAAGDFGQTTARRLTDLQSGSVIARLIRSIAAQGALVEQGSMVELCSTEADELASLCDRILVFYRGQITAELIAPGFDQHTVLDAINTGQVAPCVMTCG